MSAASKTSKPQVLFISKGEHQASTRYRALQYFPLLAAANIRAIHLVDDHTRAARQNILKAARDVAVVVMIRNTSAGLFIRRLRRAARYFVLDYDDAIFRSSRRQSRGQRRRFDTTLRLVDEAWCGNDYLAEQARSRGKEAFILETSVDCSRYQTATLQDASPFDLVWIGSSSTRKYLETILPTLERLATKLPELRLKIVADFDLPTIDLKTQAVPWSASAEIEALASAQIGLAPLVDDTWTQGKCGLKILQYMAAGLPVVATDCGVHPFMVQAGKSGFLASTDETWAQAIEKLRSDSLLRQQMGQAGQARARAEYDLEVIFSKMLERLKLHLELNS